MSELPNSSPRFPAQHVEEDGARGQAKCHLQDPAEPQVPLLLLRKSEVVLEVQRWDTNQDPVAVVDKRAVQGFRDFLQNTRKLYKYKFHGNVQKLLRRHLVRLICSLRWTK
ncbi:unnamed protein product [Leuciscus chuanchicus]